MLEAEGLPPPSALGPEHVIRRVSASEVRSLAALQPWLKPGELLTGVPSQPVYEKFWNAARADRFSAPEMLRSVHTGKHR